MSFINKEVADFAVQAYVNKDFKEVTKADLLGKWSVFFFYPADFTFVCPTELKDLSEKYAEFKESAVKFTLFLATLTLFTRHGLTLLTPSRLLSTQCSPILTTS